MLDVVIVNWNAGLQLRARVDSVGLYGNEFIGEVIVVDNGSVDGSDSSVEGMSAVTLIRAGTNLGFARACNLGAGNAKSEYLLFLNPDAALYEGTLEAALAYMQHPTHSTVGICGVQLIDEEFRIARSCARFPTVARFLAHALGIDRIFPQLGYHMHEWSHNCEREVDHVIGAFYLVRRSVFDSLGGFDERFFVYLEDLDFSRRARLAGWRSVYLATAQAFHAGGGTSRQVKALRLYYSLQSRLLYVQKHFSPVGALAVAGATLSLEPLSRLLAAVGRRSASSCDETLKAYRLLLKWLINTHLLSAKKSD